MQQFSTAERCVYTVGDYVRLNQSQSRDIICSSPRFHGSTYSHKLDSGMTTNFSANQLDMIHCEAALGMYNHLDLYERAMRDGIIKSLSSSGACVISDRGANCTQVILYVNLTYYDQRNGSIIPVCAFTSDHNLECFCIRYQTLGKTCNNSIIIPLGGF